MSNEVWQRKAPLSPLLNVLWWLLICPFPAWCIQPSFVPWESFSSRKPAVLRINTYRGFDTCYTFVHWNLKTYYRVTILADSDSPSCSPSLSFTLTFMAYSWWGVPFWVEASLARKTQLKDPSPIIFLKTKSSSLGGLILWGKNQVWSLTQFYSVSLYNQVSQKEVRVFYKHNQGLCLLTVSWDFRD